MGQTTLSRLSAHAGERVVVIPNTQVDAFLQRVLSDASLRSRIKGILVDQGACRVSATCPIAGPAIQFISKSVHMLAGSLLAGMFHEHLCSCQTSKQCP